MDIKQAKSHYYQRVLHACGGNKLKAKQRYQKSLPTFTNHFKQASSTLNEPVYNHLSKMDKFMNGMRMAYTLMAESRVSYAN